MEARKSGYAILAFPILSQILCQPTTTHPRCLVLGKFGEETKACLHYIRTDVPRKPCPDQKPIGNESEICVVKNGTA